MFNEVSVADIDGDRLDDLLFLGTGKADAVASASRDASGQFIVFNGELTPILQYGFPKKDKQLYAHAFAASLRPARNEIAINFGTVLYVIDLEGNLLGRSATAYKGSAFNGLTFDQQTNRLFGDGQIGGGTTLHSYDLTKDNWWETPQQLQGRMHAVEKNLNTLYRQTSISPFLRSGVMRAAYGARYGIISGLKFQKTPGIQILYALMKSGVLPQVKQDDILSIGSWHLIQTNEFVKGDRLNVSVPAGSMRFVDLTY